EYPAVERMARQIELPVPRMASRRSRPGARGNRPHWGAMLRQAHRTDGELLHLPRLARRVEPLPLLVLADVSGSMARYARLLLAFLHAAGGRRKGRRDVFAFGTHLTDLTPAFRLADTDEMLAAANEAIADFGGGTRLGESLATLRQRHARRLVGGRTVVLLISDGLDTGEPEALARELAWLRLHSRRLLWLNPLLRFDGYQPVARGAAVLHRHAHGMLAVHNLGTLEQLAAGLAAVMKH
ncbi:MAG: VWA domain-containing protein, partial [Pseudomonadota bacterium]